jgi:hypothetical protein
MFDSPPMRGDKSSWWSTTRPLGYPKYQTRALAQTISRRLRRRAHRSRHVPLAGRPARRCVFEDEIFFLHREPL